MTVDREDRVAVVVFVQNIQDGFRVFERRFAEFNDIGMRMKISHHVVVSGEIEHEVIAGAKAARRLAWRAWKLRVCDMNWICHRDDLSRRRCRFANGRIGRRDGERVHRVTAAAVA